MRECNSFYCGFINKAQYGLIRYDAPFYFFGGDFNKLSPILEYKSNLCCTLGISLTSCIKFKSRFTVKLESYHRAAVLPMVHTYSTDGYYIRKQIYFKTLGIPALCLKKCSEVTFVSAGTYCRLILLNWKQATAPSHAN